MESKSHKGLTMTPIEKYRQRIKTLSDDVVRFGYQEETRTEALNILEEEQNLCSHYALTENTWYNKPDDYHYTHVTCNHCGKVFRSSKYHFTPRLPNT